MRALFFIPLLAVTACATVPADGTRLPDQFTFGATLAEMTPVFDRFCDTHQARDMNVAELPVAEHSHVQVDCQGLDHAGAARLAEFVFADQQLVFTWVLTEASEHEKHLAALRQAYGDPSHSAPAFVAFADHRVALRRDVPEFLFYGDAVAPMYQAWFDQMVTPSTDSTPASD